jgi:hypothetical protein
VRRRRRRPDWRLAAIFLGVLAVVAAGAGLESQLLGTDAPAPRANTSQLRSPVPLGPDGEYIRTRVMRSGDLDVDHWIHSTTPITVLTLAAPRVRVHGSRHVHATHVVVRVPGRIVEGPAAVTTGPATYQLLGAHRVRISYLLSGALDRSRSDPRRALARVTALDVGIGPHRGATALRVLGARVLGMACKPVRPRSAARPCGVDLNGAWHVDLSGVRRDERVLAQLELR